MAPKKKTLRKHRILALMHSDLIPPDDVKKLGEQEFLELKTEYDVLQGLQKLGHEARPLGLVDDLAPLRSAITDFKPHIVFNLLEEFHGSVLLDQNVVSYLELVQVPYTGCNPRGLMIARDKALSKKILHYHRIPVPRFQVVPKGRTLRRKPAALDYPLIVKSLYEEASLGIAEASVVYNDEKLVERVEFMHEKIGSDAILEQYIDGRELYVGVIGNQRLRVLPPLELSIGKLRPDAPRIATRRVKWDPAYQARRDVRLAPAKDLAPDVARSLMQVTKRAYRLLGLSGYARMDFRLGTDNRPYFLEANPNPDIAREAELAEAAELDGLDYPALLDRVLRVGLATR
jgi:D-alanine-D-alanine ligase